MVASSVLGFPRIGMLFNSDVEQLFIDILLQVQTVKSRRLSKPTGLARSPLRSLPRPPPKSRRLLGPPSRARVSPSSPGWSLRHCMRLRNSLYNRTAVNSPFMIMCWTTPPNSTSFLPVTLVSVSPTWTPTSPWAVAGKLTVLMSLPLR